MCNVNREIIVAILEKQFTTYQRVRAVVCYVHREITVVILERQFYQRVGAVVSNVHRQTQNRLHWEREIIVAVLEKQSRYIKEWVRWCAMFTVTEPSTLGEGDYCGHS